MAWRFHFPIRNYDFNVRGKFIIAMINEMGNCYKPTVIYYFKVVVEKKINGVPWMIKGKNKWKQAMYQSCDQAAPVLISLDNGYCVLAPTC